MRCDALRLGLGMAVLLTLALAENTAGLQQERPAGGCCDAFVMDENGLAHDGATDVDNDGNDDDDHDVLTGSDENGELSGPTCEDWTSTEGDAPMAGHMWPANSGRNWLRAHNVGGCAPGVGMIQRGGGAFSGNGHVGTMGGYGAIYCFAEN